jgi:CheY-like chemotaxis protein
VLLVDDDDLVRSVVRRFLERAGHRVSEASDGRLALSEFTADPPDLVVTDIIMPGMDGLEVIAAMRRTHPSIPIVAMSGGGKLVGAEGALSLARYLGASAAFAKPLDMHAFLAAVDGLMAGSEPCTA